MTLPLGAYENIYCLKTGNRVGKFITDIRISMAENLLRVLGFGETSQGRVLAEPLIKSPIRELRWSALNYFWRASADTDECIDYMNRFTQDQDKEIRLIAIQAIKKLGDSPYA